MSSKHDIKSPHIHLNHDGQCQRGVSAQRTSTRERRLTVYPIPVVTGGKVPFTEEVIKLTAGKLTFKQL